MGIEMIRRNDSEFAYLFNQSGLELRGKYKGKVGLELKIDLFPYGFHEDLKRAVEEGVSVLTYVSLPFGKKHQLSLERQGGTKNGEVWFNFKSTVAPGYFFIELRAQEIKNFLAEMRSSMTRP